MDGCIFQMVRYQHQCLSAQSSARFPALIPLFSRSGLCLKCFYRSQDLKTPLPSLKPRALLQPVDAYTPFIIYVRAFGGCYEVSLLLFSCSPHWGCFVQAAVRCTWTNCEHMLLIELTKTAADTETDECGSEKHRPDDGYSSDTAPFSLFSSVTADIKSAQRAFEDEWSLKFRPSALILMFNRTL